MSLTSHQEIIALLANQQYISTLDVSNAFFSIALTEESAPYTAFFDHRRRRLAFKSCPQGWLNSPFFLDQLLSTLLQDIPFCKYVADDIIIATNEGFDHHLGVLETIIKRLVKAKLKIKHSKVKITLEEVEFLGVIYKRNQMDIPKKRREEYANLPVPKKAKEIKSWLASASYYRKWLPNFSNLTKPLHILTKGNAKFRWGRTEKEAFKKLKLTIAEAQPLYLPDPGMPFECYCNADEDSLTFDAFQTTVDGTRRALCYNSKLTTPTQAVYSPYRQQVAALLYGLSSLHFFFLYAPKITIHMDCKALMLLRMAKGCNSALTRNALLIEPYEI